MEGPCGTKPQASGPSFGRSMLEDLAPRARHQVTSAKTCLEEQRRPAALQRAVGHDGNAISQNVGLVHEVGREDCHAPLPDAVDDVPGGSAAEGVHAGGGLIQEGDTRAADKGEAQRKFSFLATRQRACQIHKLSHNVTHQRSAHCRRLRGRTSDHMLTRLCRKLMNFHIFTCKRKRGLIRKNSMVLVPSNSAEQLQYMCNKMWTRQSTFRRTAVYEHKFEFELDLVLRLGMGFVSIVFQAKPHCWKTGQKSTKAKKQQVRKKPGNLKMAHEYRHMSFQALHNLTHTTNLEDTQVNVYMCTYKKMYIGQLKYSLKTYIKNI